MASSPRRSPFDRLLMAAVSAAILLPSLAAAQPSPVAARPDRWVDSIFAGFFPPKQPGCAVGVVRAGSLDIARGFGSAELEHSIAITPQTVFYIASLSKQFTAMSVVLLSQDGKLGLDDDLRRWVPEVPDYGHTITLRHLLTHTSGLRDYFTLLALSGWEPDSPLTNRELLELVARQRGLNFAPGEQFLYSNTGYALLAVVVERASGLSLRDFAARRIFEPLGMSNTQYRDDHRMPIAGRAEAYVTEAGRFRRSVPSFDIVGDGGVYSTIEDMARWDANFESGRVGGKDGVALLQASGRLKDGRRIGYGFGLVLGQLNGIATVSHSGAYGGYRASYLRAPDARLGVITLCNTATIPAGLVEQVAGLYLGPAPVTAIAAFPWNEPPLTQQGRVLEGLLDPPVGALPLPDEHLALEGRYVSEELGTTATIGFRDAILVLRRGRGDDIALERSSADVYVSRDGVTLRVLRDRLGQVKGFTLSIGRVRDVQFLKAWER